MSFAEEMKPKIEKAARKHGSLFKKIRNVSIVIAVIIFVIALDITSHGPNHYDLAFITLLIAAIPALLAVLCHQFIRTCPFGMHHWIDGRCLNCGKSRRHG